VVNDQIGSPTFAGWLARVLKVLIDKECLGDYHVSSGAEISWFDFALEIVRQSQVNATVLPQSTEELARPAPRPKYSSLSVEKLTKELKIVQKIWTEGIGEYLGDCLANDFTKLT